MIATDPGHAPSPYLGLEPPVQDLWRYRKTADVGEDLTGVGGAGAGAGAGVGVGPQASHQIACTVPRWRGPS